MNKSQSQFQVPQNSSSPVGPFSTGYDAMDKNINLSLLYDNDFPCEPLPSYDPWGNFPHLPQSRSSSSSPSCSSSPFSNFSNWHQNLVECQSSSGFLSSDNETETRNPILEESIDPNDLSYFSSNFYPSENSPNSFSVSNMSIVCVHEISFFSKLISIIFRCEI